MTIGKPIKCYVFNRTKGGYIYLPYEKTEYEIIFQGDKSEMRDIRNYWVSIGKPMYDNKKSFQENMQTIYNRLGFWPEPFYSENLIQTMLLDFVEDEDMKDYFEFEKKLNMFPPDDKKNKKKVYHFDEDEFDDEIPF